jgi:hypothetical protein
VWTLRLAFVFIVVAAACSSGRNTPQPARLAVPQTRVLPPVVDAMPATPQPVGLGGACTREPAPGTTCTEGTFCLPNSPGGYCTAPCGVVGGPCAGACVETSKAGEVCMKSCSSDADCRANEGYVCDPQWKACTVPNFVAIIPKQCPAAHGEPARDTSFAASEPWSSASSPGVYQFEPTGALADDGGLVAVYGSRSAIFDGNKLGVARVDGKGKTTLDVALAAADRQRQGLRRRRDRLPR